MKVRVLDSIETSNGDRCVDLFVRPDGSFGFEIYRRDSEALSGWFPIGGFANQRFQSRENAREAAASYAPWLSKMQ